MEQPTDAAYGVTMKKIVIAMPLTTAALVIALTSCTPGLNDSNPDKQETKTFAAGADGNKDGSLPRWVPDSASDIKEVIRTTGSERIMSLRNAPIPSSCTAVQQGQKPRSGDDTDSPFKAEEFVTTAPTLRADWWPQGIEQKAQAICGKWWVTVQDGTTYAYSPERKVMVEKITREGTGK